jgi:hypothetical protein
MLSRARWGIVLRRLRARSRENRGGGSFTVITCNEILKQWRLNGQAYRPDSSAFFGVDLWSTSLRYIGPKGQSEPYYGFATVLCTKISYSISIFMLTISKVLKPLAIRFRSRFHLLLFTNFFFES